MLLFIFNNLYQCMITYFPTTKRSDILYSILWAGIDNCQYYKRSEFRNLQLDIFTNITIQAKENKRKKSNFRVNVQAYLELPVNLVRVLAYRGNCIAVRSRKEEISKQVEYMVYLHLPLH